MRYAAGQLTERRAAPAADDHGGQARARRKISQLEGAEFFTAEHAALLATMLERIDRVNAEIAQLTGVIEGCWPRMRGS